MPRLAKSVVWAEMARRKVLFHPNEPWDAIGEWGIFSWGQISHLLKSGELITGATKSESRGCGIWVQPSANAYRTKIKPLIDKYTLTQLTVIAFKGMGMGNWLSAKEVESCQNVRSVTSKYLI